MTTKDDAIRVMVDPEAQLENALIQDFLRTRGLDAAAVRMLPEADATHVLAEASRYAASKLAEVEARAHFVHELHGQG